MLVYDGDCAFCRHWVRRLREWVGDEVELLPQQHPDCRKRYPDLDPGALAESVHLVEPNGRVHRGGAAVAHALRSLPIGPGILWTYRHLPGAAPLAEAAYAWVARHRARISRTWQLIYGPFDDSPAREPDGGAHPRRFTRDHPNGTPPDSPP